MSQSKYKPGVEVPGTGYQFLRMLDEGGQGQVYLVRDEAMDRPAVMKLLNIRPGKNAKAHEAAMHEARSIGRLKSEHIVSVYTAGMTTEDRARPYFVMEYMEGAPLHRSLLRGGTVTASEAIEICIQTLKGLSVAHSHPTHPMIHRDIKPGNLFIQLTEPERSNSPSRVVILDFGIARLRDKALSEASSDLFNGTPDYAAPEQYGLLARPQTDLYAVGGLLFRMLTGRLVFQGKNPSETGRMHREVTAPRLSRFVDVPPDLDDLVASALEKDPDRRPATAELFGRWLKEIHARLADRYREHAYSERATTEEQRIHKRVELIRAEDASLSMAAEAHSRAAAASTERAAIPVHLHNGRVQTMRLPGAPPLPGEAPPGRDPVREAPTRSYVSARAAPREREGGDTVPDAPIPPEVRHEPNYGTLESRDRGNAPRERPIQVRVDPPRSAPSRPRQPLAHASEPSFEGAETSDDLVPAGLPRTGALARLGRLIPKTTSVRTFARWCLIFSLAVGVLVATIWLTSTPTYLRQQAAGAVQRTLPMVDRTAAATPPTEAATALPAVVAHTAPPAAHPGPRATPSPTSATAAADPAPTAARAKGVVAPVGPASPPPSFDDLKGEIRK